VEAPDGSWQILPLAIKLSGWDFASTIGISAADAACARPANNSPQAESRRVLKLGTVKSPRFLAFLAEPIAIGTFLPNQQA
jgi:hypothetical protein